MTTSRFLSSLVVAVALSSCGSDEPKKAAPPAAATKPAPPPAPPPAAAAKPAPSAGIPAAACVGNWKSGPTGTLACSGPGKGTAFDKATFRLDRVCVNDPRVSTYTAGGKTVTMTLKAEGQKLCATCVAPAGGDCNPPPDGFVCVAIGRAAGAGW